MVYDSWSFWPFKVWVLWLIKSGSRVLFKWYCTEGLFCGENNVHTTISPIWRRHIKKFSCMTIRCSIENGFQNKKGWFEWFRMTLTCKTTGRHVLRWWSGSYVYYFCNIILKTMKKYFHNLHEKVSIICSWRHNPLIEFISYPKWFMKSEMIWIVSKTSWCKSRVMLMDWWMDPRKKLFRSIRHTIQIKYS